MPGTLYNQSLYRASLYAGGPSTVTPPVETPLYIIARVRGPGPACCGNRLSFGNVITLEASFYRNSTAVDPASLAVIIKDPSGDVSRYDFGVDAQPVQTAVGHYYLQLLADEGGEYSFAWKAGAGMAEGSFEVEESVFV